MFKSNEKANIVFKFDVEIKLVFICFVFSYALFSAHNAMLLLYINTFYIQLVDTFVYIRWIYVQIYSSHSISAFRSIQIHSQHPHLVKAQYSKPILGHFTVSFYHYFNTATIFFFLSDFFFLSHQTEKSIWPGNQ